MGMMDMPEGTKRIRVEEVQWSGIFSWTQLFNTFRMAIRPSRLLLALTFVLLCFLGGKVLDFMWGARVYPGEITQYATQSPEGFSNWRTQSAEQVTTNLRRLLRGKDLTTEQIDTIVAARNRFSLVGDEIGKYYNEELAKQSRRYEEAIADIRQRQNELQEAIRNNQVTPELAESRRKRFEDNLSVMDRNNQSQIERIERSRQEELNLLRQVQPRGVFEAASQHVLGAFDRGVLGAVSLNFGLGDMMRTGSRESASVAGALRDVFITLPGWLYRTQFWYMTVYMLAALALWSIIGGALARMAALDATIDKAGSPAAAVEFSLRRFVWFFITPLVPFVASLLLGLLLMLGGLVFFNLPEIWLTDVIGGLLFGLAILVGFIIAVLMILTAAGGHLFYPALAVEGTDTFDATSRSFGYVIARPWQWLFYTLVSIVYFAITYLFVGMVLFLSLSIAQGFIRAAVFRESVAGGANRFDAIFPPPQLGQLMYQVQWSQLDTPGKIASALIWVWVFVTVSILAAFAISFYVNVHTWIYLLLRRSVDGTGFDEVYTEQARTILVDTSAVADKVEPASNAADTASAASPATPPADAPAAQPPASDTSSASGETSSDKA